MSVNLAPVGNGWQFFTSAGTVLSGGKINTYLAGTTTPQATFTTNLGSVPNANPIILNSAGISANEIWLTAGISYKFVITDSSNNVLQTLDNLVGINDVSSAASEWVSVSLTPTFVSGTSFTLVGNQQSTFTVGRRVQATVTAGVVYGTIASNVFGSVTTVVLVMDSGQALDSGLSVVAYGLLNPQKASFAVDFPALSVAGSVSSLTGSAAATILWAGTAVVNDGALNTGTGVITPTVPGRYLIILNGQVSSTAGNANVNFNVQKNGANYSNPTLTVVGTNASAILYSTIVYLNGISDTASIQLNNASAAVTVNANCNLTMVRLF